MHALLFCSQLLAIAIEQIHAFVYLEFKQVSLSKLNQLCRQYPVYNQDRLARSFLSSLFSTERTKNITLYDLTGHTKEYTP